MVVWLMNDKCHHPWGKIFEKSLILPVKIIICIILKGIKRVVSLALYGNINTFYLYYFSYCGCVAISCNNQWLKSALPTLITLA